MLEKIKNKHLLIDGDIVKYRCAASAEKNRYLVETMGVMNVRDYDHFDTHAAAKDFIDSNSKDIGTLFANIWSRKEVQPLEFALQATKTTIDSLLEKLAPAKVSIFLSPAHNFRDDLARTKPYKGNRTQPKPKYLKDVEKYLVREYGARIADNVEADDEIGWALSAEPGNSVSVSIDKDLFQIPGWHYDWVNDRVRNISPRDGDLAFYTQMLTGDATDNIPGLSGYGAVAAEKILKGVQSRADAATRVWGHYRSQFIDTSASGGSHERTKLEEARCYFLEQANLLWILRKPFSGDGASPGGYKCPISLE